MSEMGQGEMTVERFTGGAFAQNSYLVSCPATRRAILVDAGAGTGEAIRHARSRGLEIERIVLTHAHIDHVDSLAEAKSELGVPVLLHPADEPLYRAVAQQAEMFGIRMAPLPPTDGVLAAGDVVRFGECSLEVRHAPGHAPGHVVLVGDGVALVGDLVFQGSIGRTDLPGGDFQQLMRSIRSEILTLPDETTLYPGHGPETTVGHERASNPFLVPHYGHGGFA
jgi:glyoxylase-like metal-dependent hydrolase (beta-lactamase superfamily II)